MDLVADTPILEVRLNAYHLGHFPLAPPANPCRVIPYPRNEDIVDRTSIFVRLDAVLPPSSSEYHTAALWGLGGSG
jgi:hypothetical protein